MTTVFSTLQDFFKSIGLPLQQDFELTIHRLEGLHGEGRRKSPLFRTNYYAFLLISGGKSSYTIDGQAFDLSAGSFYFTNPGHLKSFEIEIPLEGFMVTFSESFVKQFFAGDFYQLFPFLLQESTPVMRLNELIISDLKAILEQMLAEYNSNNAYKKEILTNQLMILLYKTKELLLSHKVSIKSSSRAVEILTIFQKTINENFKNLAQGKDNKVLTIKEIADKLNIHPNYLSNVIKEESGKSATEWIQERTAAEAQSFLRNSNKSISEIAFDLGFTDSTHFAKFFKKMVGQSPTEFRKNHKKL